MLNLIKSKMEAYKGTITSFALIILVITSYSYGYRSMSKKCKAKILTIETEYKAASTQAAKDAIENYIVLQSSLSDISTYYQDTEKNIEQEQTVIEREVIRYVKNNPDDANCTMSDASVSLHNALVKTANSGRDPRAGVATTD